jgi:hypothetical protein
VEKIFDAAEKTGGVEYNLVEQEGSSAYPPLENVERWLATREENGRRKECP